MLISMLFLLIYKTKTPSSRNSTKTHYPYCWVFYICYNHISYSALLCSALLCSALLCSAKDFPAFHFIRQLLFENAIIYYTAKMLCSQYDILYILNYTPQITF